MEVVVTGAKGQTAHHLFHKLLAMEEEFDPVGIVRSEESKAALVEAGVPESAVAVVDVTDAASVKVVAERLRCLLHWYVRKVAPHW